MARADIATAPDNFNALNDIAKHYLESGDYTDAIPYLRRSIQIQPNETNYSNLGFALMHTGDYPGAADALDRATKANNIVTAYELRAILTLLYGDRTANSEFLKSAIDKYPQDATIWSCVAIQQQRRQDNDDAKISISNAASTGATVDQAIYQGIMNNQPFQTNLAGISINVP